MIISGCVSFKNKKDRKKLYRAIRDEFGSKCKIWSEDKLLMYQYNASRKEIYF